MEEKNKLEIFIESTRDARELKRGLAVRMKTEGKKRAEIGQMLGMSISYVDKHWRRYRQEGVSGLKMGHKGDPGKLTSTEQKEIIEWLQEQSAWDLLGLRERLRKEYGVEYKSRQSYYDLFKRAGISWKKTQKRNPGRDEKQVEEKRGLIKKTKCRGGENKAKGDSGTISG